MVWAVVVTVLTLLVLHWFPWQMMLGRRLPRLAAYVTGLLAILLPLTVVHWGSKIVFDIWLATLAGGIATVLAWFLDWVLDKNKTVDELKELLDYERGQNEKRLEVGAGYGTGEEQA